MFRFRFWSCDLVYLTLHFQSLSCVAAETFLTFLKFQTFWKFLKFSKSLVSPLPPPCLLWYRPAVVAHGAAARASRCLSWLRWPTWRSLQGWTSWFQEEFSPLPPYAAIWGRRFPFLQGIVGSNALCSRPAPLMTVLLSAASSCRAQLLIWSHLCGYPNLF